VFAFGGPHEDDDAAETGYYSLRFALAFHFSLISQHLVERGVAKQSVPLMVSLSRGIAARFGVAASDKIALQMVPLVGAAACATRSAGLTSIIALLGFRRVGIRRHQVAWNGGASLVFTRRIILSKIGENPVFDLRLELPEILLLLHPANHMKPLFSGPSLLSDQLWRVTRNAVAQNQLPVAGHLESGERIERDILSQRRGGNKQQQGVAQLHN
jgi:hypothetical protein